MLLENNDYARDVRVRQEATSLAANGYVVDVICPGPEPGIEQVDQRIRIWRYRARFSGDGLVGYALEYGYAMLASMLLSIRVAMRGGFDVIHAHNPPDTFVFIALFYKLFGKRFVFDHHDLSGELYRYARFDAHPRLAVYKLLLGLEKLSCRVADYVIVTNQSYRDLAIKRSGVAAERVTVVRNGPELRTAEALEITAVAETTSVTMPAGRVIGYVGIMGHQDGVDMLLHAVDWLRRSGPSDFHVMLVGSGDAVANLQALAHTLGLTSVVTFVGWVEPDQIPTYLKAFDICVAPEPANGYTELCTMIKVMEYMAYAKPVVAFDLLEHRRTAGTAALFAPANDPAALADRIRQLMDDPDLGRRLGQAGRERVEADLAWEYQERALLAVYAKVCAGFYREPPDSTASAGTA